MYKDMNKRKIFKSVIAGALAVVMTVLLLTNAIPTRVHAESSSEIRNQISALESEKANLQAQLNTLEQQKQDNLSEIQNVVNQKNNIDMQIVLIIREIENTNDQISAYNVLIADKQEELDAAEIRLAELRAANKERIRTMEEEGALSFWSVLFKANSFADLLDRMNMIQEIADADRRRMDAIREAAKEVETAQQELHDNKAELEVVKAELDDSQIVLQEKRAESDALLADLISRGEEYQQLLEEGELAVENLLAQIAAQEQRYTEAKRKEYEQWLSTSVAPETTKPKDPEKEEEKEEEEGSEEDEPSAPITGGWVVPCSYIYVSSVFRPDRPHPVLGIVRPHNGIDLAASTGTPVYATRTGTVTTASVAYEAGNYVVINHYDGFSSVYMHLDYFIVEPGQYVSAGECIGYVGSTGLSSGPHLHFGISYNGTYVNPANYIRI